MKCASSNIEPRTDLTTMDSGIRMHGTQREYAPKVAHAGLMTHTCDRERHEDTQCRCVCGTTWMRNFKAYE